MAKSRNQKFFTDILYGSETSSGILRLESTTSPTKGSVEVVGSQIDFIIAGQTGRFVHANTALRTYSLPDTDGTLVVGGIFTGSNQLLYSTGAGTFTVLAAANSSVLTSDGAGVPTWVSGSNGQFLQISGGVPIFGPLPASVGTIDNAPANTVAVYKSPGPGNALEGLTTTANRALLSPSGTLTWGLIQASYLSASGGVPLGNGTLAQKLKSNGDGTFYWDDDPAVINQGIQNRLAYYSAATPGTTVDDSGFLEVNEATKTLNLINHGRLRFYEETLNGSAYLEFRAPASLGSSTVFTLPSADGAAGAYLITDGSGNLSFQSIDNGSVANGLANQLAYYAVNGNDVSGLATTSARALLSPSGIPTWTLITAPYLSASGGIPLSNGSLNQVLVSTGTGNFNWVTASSLVGQVNSGTATFATYYAASGTTVSASSFVAFDDINKRVDLRDNGALRFYETANTNYVQLKAPAALAGSTSYILPATDGAFEHALVTDGAGNLSFIEVGRGIVNSGTTNTLAYYAAPTNSVFPLPQTSSSVLLTTGLNTLYWGLITEGYMSSTGGSPLSGGTPGQVLISDGLGNFNWINASSLVGTINAGISGYLAYYSASGQQIDDTSFLFIDNSSYELHLQNQGELRFYEATDTNYAALKAHASLSSDLTWYLPIADASLAGQVLVSDASGNLSFEDQVDPGTTNAVAYYQGVTRRVSPSTLLTHVVGGLEASSTLTIAGVSSAAPAGINIYAGSGVGVAGTDIVLRAGTSDISSYGAVKLQVGSIDVLNIEDLNPGLFATVEANASLRFLDNAGTNFIGFTAPSTVSSDVIWELPAADGALNQVLATDGAGVLSWVTVPVGIGIASGSANVLAYYDTATSIAAVSDIEFELGNSAIGFLDNSKIKFYELTVNGSSSIALSAPASLASSYSLELPEIAPAANQVMYAKGASSLSFEYADAIIEREKRGSVTVPSGVSSVTVIYEEPFDSTPQNIQAQWSIESVSGLALMPTIAIMSSNAQGFVIKLSATTATSYKIYWHSYLSGDTTAALLGYFGGGGDSGTPQNTIYEMNLDNDVAAIALSTSLSSARSYMGGTSSSFAGYLSGGEDGIGSIDTISTFTYATGVVADLGATLSADRSGAASVGTRAAGYLAGGEEIGVGTNTDIEKIDHTTDTASTITGPLNSSALKRGSCHSTTDGYVVHNNGTSTVDVFNFTLETVSAGPNNFGVSNIEAGCNDNAYGYFAKDDGSLYSYEFSTDTIVSLPNPLTSNTGISGAFNSLENGYFFGVSAVEKLDFVTQSVASVNALAFVSADAASIATFQTRGLL